MGWHARRHDQHAIKPKAIAQFNNAGDVSAMDRIKCAAKDANAAWNAQTLLSVLWTDKLIGAVARLREPQTSVT